MRRFSKIYFFWIGVAQAAKNAFVVFLVFCTAYTYFEPLAIRAASANNSITVTQAVSQEISIAPASNVTMSASIPGMTGNPGSPRTGSATWLVKTTNSTGFIMAMKAGAAPAMSLDATYKFIDYTPAATSTPDYNWTSPASGEAEFGYSVKAATAADATTLFKDNASNACNTSGGQTVGKCWYNFTASDVNVINRSTNTTSSGEAEVVNFQTESNAKFLKEGDYTATITATVTEN
jgi:hypothetical protein